MEPVLLVPWESHLTREYCISFPLFILFDQVTQLTGFSDPIYAEAYVNVNQYDIVLDVLIVNQTSDTLQNVTLELATLGMYLYHLNFNYLYLPSSRPKPSIARRQLNYLKSQV